MATEPKKQSYLLGECKYKNSAVTLSGLQALRGKFNPGDGAGKVYYSLFSKSGFTNEVLHAAKTAGVMLVTAEEIVRG